jgi:hypothetical protein
LELWNVVENCQQFLVLKQQQQQQPVSTVPRNFKSLLMLK